MSCQQLRLRRKSRYDHDVRVALDLKTGEIACPQVQWQLLADTPAGGHEEAVARAEDAIEAAILTQLDAVQRDPDGIDAVRIFGADVTGNRVGAACRHRRIVDRKGDARRPRAFPLAEARRGGEQQD